MINLEQAIEKQEFCVYYQPVCDAKTEEIVAAEALVRWIPEQPEAGAAWPFHSGAGGQRRYYQAGCLFVNQIIQEEAIARPSS